jgi:hypothetical protein
MGQRDFQERLARIGAQDTPTYAPSPTPMEPVAEEPPSTHVFRDIFLGVLIGFCVSLGANLVEFHGIAGGEAAVWLEIEGWLSTCVFFAPLFALAMLARIDAAAGWIAIGVGIAGHMASEAALVIYSPDTIIAAYSIEYLGAIGLTLREYGLLQ